VQAFDFLGTSPSGSDSHWRVPQNSAPQLILSSSLDVRAHASVFNHSSAALYLKYGSNAGMAVSGGLGLFDVRLSSGSYYELPKPMWQGQIWGAWDADASGFAMIVQLGRTGA
jgi:hypothetical protein